jgi:hypothetical protein
VARRRSEPGLNRSAKRERSRTTDAWICFEAF